MAAAGSESTSSSDSDAATDASVAFPALALPAALLGVPFGRCGGGLFVGRAAGGISLTGCDKCEGNLSVLSSATAMGEQR